MYGFILGTGYITLLLIAEKIVKLKKITKVKKNFWTNSIIIYLLAIIGGRLYHVLDNYTFYFSNPIKIIYFWNGGFGIFGAFIFLIGYLIIYCKIYKINFLIFSDLILLLAPYLIIMGRIANLINNEIKIAAFEIIPISALQMYFIFKFKNIKFGEGKVSSLFLLVYGFTRIIIEPLREAQNSFYIQKFNLTYFFAVFIISIGFGIILKAQNIKNFFK